MSRHLTAPAPRAPRVLTPMVSAILTGLAVIAIVFGAFLAAELATGEPTHQMRRVHVVEAN